ITGQLGVGSYAGVPVFGPGGVAVGMVSVIGQKAKPDLADDDLRIVQQVAELIATLIETSDGNADPTAAQRKAIRRVVAEGDFEMVFQS
ncbi:diguanylate phosphodiesterase, partial [Mycobacterium sp. ITM-2017-0098]